MASVIKRSLMKNVGTTDATIYQPPADTVAVLIGMNIANTTNVTCIVDIKYKVSDTVYYVLKGIAIPPNSSFTPTGQEQKLVMMPTDVLIVTSDQPNSLDVILSYSEIS